jgi:hypothetical protein
VVAGSIPVALALGGGLIGGVRRENRPPEEDHKKEDGAVVEASRYESAATLLREYLDLAKMTDGDFGRRLEKGEAGAAIIFAASRLETAIGEAAAEVVRAVDQIK